MHLNISALALGTGKIFCRLEPPSLRSMAWCLIISFSVLTLYSKVFYQCRTMRSWENYYCDAPSGMLLPSFGCTQTRLWRCWIRRQSSWQPALRYFRMSHATLTIHERRPKSGAVVQNAQLKASPVKRCRLKAPLTQRRYQRSVHVHVRMLSPRLRLCLLRTLNSPRASLEPKLNPLRVCLRQSAMDLLHCNTLL
jgi:hypothetical protein